MKPYRAPIRLPLPGVARARTLILTLGLALTLTRPTSPAHATEHATESMLTRESMGAEQRNDIMTLVRETLDATYEKRAPSYPEPLLQTYRRYRNGLQILLLHEGTILGSAWADEGSLLANIRQAAGRAAYEAPETARTADILVALFLPAFPASEVAAINVQYPPALGAEGYRVRYRNRTGFLPPLELALQPQDWFQVLCDLAQQVTPAPGQGGTRNPTALLKTAVEPGFALEIVPTMTLAGRAGSSETTALYRLAPLVEEATLTKNDIDAALDLALDWYLENQLENGLFPPLYDPLKDEAQLRSPPSVQLWNVVALAHLWQYTGRPEARVLALQALEQILGDSYLESTEPELGYIVQGRGGDRIIRLGHSAAALAAIMLLQADAPDEPFARHAARLRATLTTLRFPDGRYATYLHPADRSGHESLDPGMAQYALILDAMRTRNGEQAEAGFQSFVFYREAFKQAQESRQDAHAFVPWHTLANRQLYTATRRQELADFVFASTLWALGNTQQIAQTQGRPLPLDERGRIHLPEHWRNRQPPPLSDTGLFMVAAAEALALSRSLGGGRADPETAQRNAELTRHIRAGARYLLQMQYAGGYDLLLVREPKRVRGAFRRHPGGGSISLEDMSMAVWGLCRIGEVLGEGN